MYCSKCGAFIPAQHNFCPACGSQATAVPPVVVPLQANRVARHIQILGILWLVSGAWKLLSLLIALPFLMHIFGGHAFGPGSDWFANHGAFPFGPSFGTAIVHAFLIIGSVRAILALITGFALLTRRPWGRVFAIVVAIVSLVSPILGTVAGIYTLVIMCGSGADYEYAQFAEPS